MIDFNFDYLLAAFWVAVLIIPLIPMAIMEGKKNV